MAVRAAGSLCVAPGPRERLRDPAARASAARWRSAATWARGRRCTCGSRWSRPARRRPPRPLAPRGGAVSLGHRRGPGRAPRALERLPAAARFVVAPARRRPERRRPSRWPAAAAAAWARAAAERGRMSGALAPPIGRRRRRSAVRARAAGRGRAPRARCRCGSPASRRWRRSRPGTGRVSWRDPPVGRTLRAGAPWWRWAPPSLGAAAAHCAPAAGASRPPLGALASIAMLVAALGAAGLPLRLLAPGRWDELGDGLHRGLEGVQTVDWPYTGRTNGCGSRSCSGPRRCSSRPPSLRSSRSAEGGARAPAGRPGHTAVPLRHRRDGARAGRSALARLRAAGAGGRLALAAADGPARGGGRSRGARGGGAPLGARGRGARCRAALVELP